MDKNSSIQYKTNRIILNILVVGLLTAINYSCASVAQSAHKSQSYFYKLFVGKKFNLKNKFKILAFIEKLSGRSIGFYCYDFFPMNRFEFFQYNFIFAANYLLISGLIQNL